MSNSIDLENHVVVFAPSDLDFLELRKKLRFRESEPSKEMDYEGWLIYNHLQGSVRFFEDRVIVAFGKGKIMLTWKAFEDCVNLIFKPLMRNSFVVSFRAKDLEQADAGYGRWVSVWVDFKEGVDLHWR